MEKASVDKGVRQFVDSLVKFVLYAILIFSIGSKFGLDTTSVAAALASCGVAIGLALQGSLSNFAGGVLILVLKPFVVGDYIVEDNKGREGTVKEIQLFYTKLLTVDNRTVIIPNGSLANTSLTNVTAQDKRRLDLSVGISYDADLKMAKELIEGLFRADEDILKEEGINVFVDNLGDSSVVIGARGWVKKDAYWTTKWRLTENIKLTLDENGIEIPFNQVVVHVKEQ
jgi:small conductance mechanosensitive channel